MIRLLIVISVIAWFVMLQRFIWRKWFENEKNEKNDSLDIVLSWFLTIPITIFCAAAGMIISSTLIWVYNGF